MKLEDIRKNIDETDRELFKLFEKRMALAKEVSLSKIETGDKIYKPEREDVVIDKFSSAAPDDMKQYYKSFIPCTRFHSRRCWNRYADSCRTKPSHQKKGMKFTNGKQVRVPLLRRQRQHA